MPKHFPRAFCLHCKQKVTIEGATKCGSRISGKCPECGNKVSTLHIKECADPKPFEKRINTRAMIKKKAKAAMLRGCANTIGYNFFNLQQ